MIADRHVHTAFSADSNEEPENAVKKAISLGMKDIYITDHYDIDFLDGSFMFDPDDYFETLTKLQNKYKGTIDLHIGVEVRLGEEIANKLDRFINRYPFEYVIGSIHLVDGKDPYLRDMFDMSDEQYYRRFFETTIEGLKSCGGFDALGHLDYTIRYGYTKDENYKYETYAELLDEILKEIVRRGIVLEVNTAPLKKGLRHAHPYPEILLRYKELGGSALTMGSDAHEAKYIGYKFEETLEFLKTLGFSEENFI